MNDYSKWRQKSARVTSLFLDHKNPRIPDQEAEASQREIVSELLTYEKVYDLAKSIAEVGFFPNELLIAVLEDKHHVVLEGNRRLAALKMLLSPELAPETYVSKFRALQDKIPSSSIESVEISVAPSREAAAPLIIRRHTAPGVNSWKTNQQAKYYRTLMTGQSELEIERFAKQFGIDKSQLKRDLRTDTLYQIACSLDLPKEVRGKVSDVRKFNYSTFERLFGSKLVPEFLGFKFDDAGGIIGHVESKEFVKGFSRILTDIVKGDVDTRSLNNSEDINGYLGRLGKDKPDTSKKGTFTAGTLMHREASMVRPTNKSAKSTSVHKLSASVLPNGLKCEVDNTRIREVFKELKHLKIESHPCTSMVMLRVMIELLTANYLIKTGKMEKMLSGGKFKGRKDNWLPTLSQMLRELLNDADFDLDRHAKRNLEKVVNDDTHIFSIDRVDQYVHNLYADPTEREIRGMWNMIEPIVLKLLVDPEPVPAGA